MAAQETANVAALAVRVCSPDAAAHPHYINPYQVNTFGNDEGFEDAAIEKENFQNILNGPLKLATDRPEIPTGMISEPNSADNPDDLADIYISDEVLKQLMSQTEEKGKQTTKQTKRKLVKPHRKAIKTQVLNNKEAPDTNVKELAKKIMKPPLRRKSGLFTSKSHFTQHGDQIEIRAGKEECIGNKAENNNWMANEEMSDLHNSLATSKFYTKTITSYLDTVTQASDTLCKMSSLGSGTSMNCKEITDIFNPVINKEFSFKRADSSDDSGCFSNLSTQSVSSAGAETRDVLVEEHHMSKETAVITDKSSSNPKSNPKSYGLCNACGHETQGPGSELCKACRGRIKQDGSHIGALGELRAYAQSIAESVKKILSISPRQNNDNYHSLTSNDDEDGAKKSRLHPEDKSTGPGAQLHKCKTQISMTASEEIRSKNRLNKSLSFDGRAAVQLDESNRSSPVYWISQDKSKLPISSTIPEADEDKLRTHPENTIDHSLQDGDYFSSSGKEAKQCSTRDEDKNSNRDRGDKARKKGYMKQLSYIEKNRTDGDACENYLQLDKNNVKHENTKMSEFHRSRSRIARTGNMKSDKFVKNSQKHIDEMNALNVFRLKVIHEGSPVDPLNTVQRRKGEESRDRRTALMRSATAPDKKHVTKKDNSSEGKPEVMKKHERAKTMNMKLAMRIGKTPPLSLIEDTVKDVKEKLPSLYEPQAESWREDSSIMAIVPCLGKRSTSYDESKPLLSKLADQHRSVFRSTTERDNKAIKERRRASFDDKSSITKNTENEGKYSVKKIQKFILGTRIENYKKLEVSLSPLLPSSQVSFTDSTKRLAVEPYHTMEPYKDDVFSNDLNDIVSRVLKDQEQIALLESSTKSPDFAGAEYYTQPCQLFSSGAKDLNLIRNLSVTNFDTESYYCPSVKPDFTKQLSCDRALTFGSVDVESILKDGDQEDTYHNEIKKYDVPGSLSGKSSPLYSSQTVDRVLIARDRSHESKSSTSFHILSTVKSSHSDVALMKYQGSWEYVSSRRQSMYSETDVDTGFIYHIAKRQTTRAHVPAYHDLTSTSKDIYTMSGDVSKSASSNSGISTKSEVSDCIYTGGFFKHDPFYDNDSRVSSSNSSADSSSHIYFEPCNVTKQELSELDIYTGALFSSSQNALSLANTREMNSTNISSDALKDGSTNNSTRPPVNKISRRLRYRPHIDVIKFKSTDSVSEFVSKSIEPNNDMFLCNASNNSCNWYALDTVYQGAAVKQSMDPFYTDYGADDRPVFNLRQMEKSAPMLDFLKYEEFEKSSNNDSFTQPLERNVADETWYSGFRQRKQTEPIAKHTPKKRQDIPGLVFSWQYDDDYYRSLQRPSINRTNNCNCTAAEQIAYNTNNNRFEDLYTGFFEASSAKNYVPEEQNNTGGKTPPDNWYADQTNRSHSPTFFSDKSQPVPEYVSGSSTPSYGSAEKAYSSTSVFGQASAAYSESSTYMAEGGWREYDKNRAPSVHSFDESPNFTEISPASVSIGEKYSYFPYGSNKSPPEGSYQYDNDTYAFDQRGTDYDSVNEIRKVGGIVCRDNVANKEDYAEDINRDLEQGSWMPFTFTREETHRHQEEPNLNRSELAPDIHRPVATSGTERLIKHMDENYNQDLIYDNMGSRNKWREMANKKQQETVKKKKKQSPIRGHPGGDARRQEYMKLSAWNPPDHIPARALGKRPTPNVAKPTVIEGSTGTSKTANVISSVTSIPSRLTNYVKKWF